MKKYLIFLWLQLKLAVKSIPMMLLGTAILAGFLVVGVIAVDSTMSEDEVAGMNIALVVNDDNKYTDMAINLLMGEESIANLCNFVKMTEEEAMSDLQKGSVAAVIVVPQNFLASILNGTNIPARIIMPDDEGYSQTAVFRELVNSGATDLATAQAAIYAVDDLCIAAGIDAIAESEDYLNKNLFLYALSRNSYYEKVEVSKTGSLTLVEFYIASGIVMFLMFAGITCAHLLEKGNSALSVCLSRVGVNSWQVILSKIFSVSVIFFAMLSGVYVLTGLFTDRNIAIMSIIAIAVSVFAIFSIDLLIFQMSDNRVTGAIVLFVATIIMMFAGGNIVPEMFLPKAVNVIGNFMPTKWIVNLIGQVITGEVVAASVLVCMGIGTGITALTIVFRSIERR